MVWTEVDVFIKSEHFTILLLLIYNWYILLYSGIFCFFKNVQHLAKMLNFIFIEVRWKSSCLSWLNFKFCEKKRIKRTCIMPPCKMTILFQDVVTGCWLQGGCAGLIFHFQVNLVFLRFLQVVATLFKGTNTVFFCKILKSCSHFDRSRKSCFPLLSLMLLKKLKKEAWVALAFNSQ